MTMKMVPRVLAASFAAVIVTVMTVAGFPAASPVGADSGGGGDANYTATLDNTYTFTSANLGEIRCRYRAQQTNGLGPASINQPYSFKIAANNSINGMDGPDACRRTSDNSLIYGTSPGTVFLLGAHGRYKADGTGYIASFPGILPGSGAGPISGSWSTGPAGYAEGRLITLVAPCEVLPNGQYQCGFPDVVTDETYDGWTTFP